MDEFLAAFHSHLRRGAPVVMFDERESGERRVPASRMDDAGNRYERRKLGSGEQFEIIKNLFEADRLSDLVGGYALGVTYRELRFFWTLEYRVA